jgi:opacity protein-like surface antigen
MAILMVSPAALHAQPVTGPYVSLSGGVNLQQNELIDAAPLYHIPANHYYNFHPGYAGQASVGYGFGYGFRAEIEGNFLDNVVRGYGPDSNHRAGGVEQKYGGMVNVLYDVNLGLPVFPYIGLGAGGQELDHIHINQSTPGFVFPSQESEQTVGAFAYQGIAGVALPFSFVRGLSLTAEYRFLGLLDPLPAFHATRYSASAPPSPESRHWSNDYNHGIMLGLRYALFQPPLPLPPPPPLAQIPIPAAVIGDRTYLVFFDWDRADLTVRARQIVAEAASLSTHVRATRIDVNGYTDLSGAAAYNQKLSVRRALSVEAELVRDGVAKSEIDIRGFGESNPLLPTAEGVREPQNRRVEIVMH